MGVKHSKIDGVAQMAVVLKIKKNELLSGKPI